MLDRVWQNKEGRKCTFLLCVLGKNSGSITQPTVDNETITVTPRVDFNLANSDSIDRLRSFVVDVNRHVLLKMQLTNILTNYHRSIP